MKKREIVSNNYKMHIYILLIVIIVVCIISVIIVKYKYNNNDITNDVVNNLNKYSNINDYTWVRRNVEFYIDNKMTSKVDNMYDKYLVFDKDFISYCIYENNECVKYSYKTDDIYLYVYADNNYSYKYKIDGDILTFYLKEEKYDSIYYYVKIEE